MKERKKKTIKPGKGKKLFWSQEHGLVMWAKN